MNQLKEHRCAWTVLWTFPTKFRISMASASVNIMDIQRVYYRKIIFYSTAK